MILKEFLKPKWQHRDPDVRRKAVEELPSSEIDILTQVAIEDKSPVVRQRAMDRLIDLNLLHRLAKEDSDQDTRRFAHSLLLNLLAGTREKSPSLDTRTEFLSRHTDTESLEFIALNAAEPEFRKSAQDQISRESLLQDVVVADAVLSNRQAALQRIEDPSILEAVIRHTRHRDKQIYRQSRMQLDAIREAEERSLANKAEAENICSTLNSMGRGDDWERELDELRRIEDRWQAIGDEVDPSYRARYETGRDAFLKASTAFRESREAEKRRWDESAARRQAILAQIAESKQGLLNIEELSIDAEKRYAEELKSWRAAWDNAGDLPSEQAQPLDQQCALDTTAILGRLDALRQNRELKHTLDAITREAEQLQDAKRPVLEKEVKSLEKQWKAVQWPENPERFTEDLKRFEEIDRKLRKRLAHQREQRDKKLALLPDLLDQLSALLKENRSKEASPLHDQIQSSINHLQALGVPMEQLDPYIHKLHGTDPQLSELKSWRAWGADEARQRLCTDMESLIGSEMGPNDLAARIRHLRTDWNQLRADGGTGFRTLHKRFDKAASEAYRPCEAFFKQQSEERDNNLEAKRALLQQLDEFLETVDETEIDWKAAHKFCRRITNDWQRTGPVDRRKSKEINQRFQERIKVLNEQLGEERQRNLEQRQALIERVRNLADVEDIGRAINQCKGLQTEWQVTVPGKRKQENTIWKEFREACDAVFLRRKQEQDARHEMEKQDSAKKKELCEQIEELAKCTIDDLSDSVRRVHKISDQWRALRNSSKRNINLDKRFERAQHAFRSHTEALHEADELAQLDQLRMKAGYCLDAEELLELIDSTSVQPALEALEKAWLETPPLRDEATEQAIQRRFDQVRTALRESGEKRESLLSELGENLEQQRNLCLRMEILTGVESPPEARQARMEFQTARLTKAMSQGSEDPIGKIDEIQREWYLMGGAPLEEEKILQERFERACKGQ